MQISSNNKVSQATKFFISLIGLMLLTLPLMALEGLPGLSYGMQLSEAGETLQNLGFVSSDEEGLGFRHPDNSQIQLITDSTAEFVAGWTVHIPLVNLDADAFEEEILAVLASFHGSEYDYDPTLREAWWRLDEYRFLSTWMAEDQGAYLIYYGDNRSRDHYED